MSTKGYYTNPKMMVWYFVNDFFKAFMMTTHCCVIFKLSLWTCYCNFIDIKMSFKLNEITKGFMAVNY